MVTVSTHGQSLSEGYRLRELLDVPIPTVTHYNAARVTSTTPGAPRVTANCPPPVQTPAQSERS